VAEFKLDGWLMKPAASTRPKKYPLVFYVYGETRGPDGDRPLDRQPVLVAPDAHSAGITSWRAWTIVHTMPPRSGLAQGCVQASRNNRLGGSSGGGAGVAQTSLP